MHRVLAMALAFTATLALAAPAAADPVSIVAQEAITQANAQRFVLHSERLGRDFEVVVQLPRAKVFLPGQKLAAIYALDGGYGLAGPNSVFLAARDIMAPAVVVSIGYLPGQPNLRDTDLTHNPFTQGERTAGGGGAAFEAFLRQDLQPFIEARFPADHASSVLFGHSLGGVFTANVFARDPDAFAGYIIGSVVVPRDPGLVDRVKQAAARAQGRRVFLAVGGAEDATTSEARGMAQGFKQLEAAFGGHPGVALQAKSYPGQNHISYYPDMLLDGFRFTLPPNVPVNLPYTALPESTIARYVGTYALPDGKALAIKAGPEGLLSAQVGDAAPVYLLPNGADRYYAYTADLDVTFDAQGLTLTGRGGAKARAARK